MNISLVLPLYRHSIPLAFTISNPWQLQIISPPLEESKAQR